MFASIYNTKLDSFSIADIVQQLRKGAVGIFPTDTVYGIGCYALDIKALQKLYQIKERDLSKPINILVSSLTMAEKFIASLGNLEKKLMEHFWPGPLTIIFPKVQAIPNLLTAGLDTVGIRMPDNKICLEIIEQLGAPLAMSSANISNQPPDICLEQLLPDFSEKVNFIINAGTLDKQCPSTIIKVEQNKIKMLREGSISMKDIQVAIGGK